MEDGSGIIKCEMKTKYWLEILKSLPGSLSLDKNTINMLK
jgi:hypothetical protein